MNPLPKPHLLLLILAGSLMALPGCDSDGQAGQGQDGGPANAYEIGNTDDPQAQDVRTVEIKATEFTYSPEKVVAQPGETLRIKLVNEGQVKHMWGLRDRQLTHVHAGPGETEEKVITVPEATGEYEIYCDVYQHARRGMTGKLVVE
ncbi:MAG: cupredoxin domain-containing protein [Akkermansiaceae bacterium]|nr:cupredoxin domain-containing protein [Akkermansiaceae bacterium]